jgi:CBS domain-containing protein
MLPAMAVTPDLLHLSLIAGGELRDTSGGRLGKVDDLIVRLGDSDFPPVSGALASVANRQVFVPASQIGSIAHGRIDLRAKQLNVQPFSRRPQEVLLRKDVLDRQLINVDGARLVRANEIELARLDGWYRVVGVETGMRSLMRRLLPRPLAARVRSDRFLSWASVEPFTGHVPTVRLRIPHPKLARLHPAQLADLVEAASHSEGQEIIDALRTDQEREADVFEELDDQHRLEFIEERPDGDVAAVMAEMEPDDAADLVAQLPEERREPIVRLLPIAQRRRVRRLLGFDPSTAGGLMSPEFVCVYGQATQDEVVAKIRRSKAPAEVLTAVYVMGPDRRLIGGIALADLLRSDPDLALDRLPVSENARVEPDAELEEVARLMSDYDLNAVPVVDEREQMIGVVTVDDVLEVVLPKSWRRQFGVFGTE